ncbi:MULTISPECIES: hypothetical protein [unclassified Diaminobutyricimonas]|uniref:hypothetical protein n=1 Tax=unclassified Diaminobutyricimonas TaxID=2643261 RepID=UPI0012F482AB|nr:MULTISPECIES: hypothetical protein [unclassified Diaminobutyricimonas]
MAQLGELMAIVVPVLFWIVGGAIGLLIFYTVVRAAVRRALRDHQEWLEDRGLR